MSKFLDFLEILLNGVSGVLISYGIIRLISLGIELNELEAGGNAIAMSDGIAGILGSVAGGVITVLGSIIVQKMRQKNDLGRIKEKLSDICALMNNNMSETKSEIKETKSEVKEVKAEVMENRDRVSEKVANPVRDIKRDTSDTLKGVNYLVKEQEIRKGIKESLKKEDTTEVVIKAQIEKVFDENIRLNKENQDLKHSLYEKDNFLEGKNNEISKLKDENYKLQLRISELNRQINRDEFEL